MTVRCVVLDQMRITYTTMFASARDLQLRLTTDQKLVAEFETVADTRCSADELLFHYAIEKVYIHSDIGHAFGI